MPRRLLPPAALCRTTRALFERIDKAKFKMVDMFHRCTPSPCRRPGPKARATVGQGVQPPCFLRRRMDTDSNGRLDKEELRLALCKMGLPLEGARRLLAPRRARHRGSSATRAYAD